MFDYFDTVKVKYIHYYKGVFVTCLAVLFAISVVFGLYTSCNFQSDSLSKYGCQKFQMNQGQYYSIRPDYSTIYMSRSYEWTQDDFDGKTKFEPIYTQIIYSKVGDQEQFLLDISVNASGIEIFRFSPTSYFEVPTSVYNFVARYYESRYTDSVFSATFIFSDTGNESMVFYRTGKKLVNWTVPHDVLSSFQSNFSSILTPVKLAQTYTCNNCMLPGSHIDFQVMIKFLVTTSSTTAALYTLLVIIMQLVSQRSDRLYTKLNSNENENLTLDDLEK